MPDILARHIPLTLCDGAPMRLPYWEVNAPTDGPVLLVVAAQHGNEVQGSECIRRFVQIAGDELNAGRVLGVPFCNLLAVRQRRHHDTQTPEEPVAEQPDRNTNRLWPGDPEGNDIQRQVHGIYSNLGAGATHAIDIHCWCRFWAAACLPRRDRPRSLELATVSALPFARRTERTSAPGTGPRRTSLGATFNDSGRVALSFELSGQYVVEEKQVRLGLRCLTNIARFLGMMPGDPEGTDEGPVWMDDGKSVEVVAPCDGLFVATDLEPGDWVQEGQLLGHLLREDNLSTEVLRAPVGGRLEAYGAHRVNSDVALPAMHPYVTAGDLVARVIIPATT